MTDQKEVDIHSILGKEIQHIDDTLQNALVIHFTDYTQISIIAKAPKPPNVPDFPIGHFQFLAPDNSPPPIETVTVEQVSLTPSMIAEWKLRNPTDDHLRTPEAMIEDVYGWKSEEYEVKAEGQGYFTFIRKATSTQDTTDKHEPSWILYIKFWVTAQDKIAIMKNLRRIFSGLGFDDARNAVEDLNGAIAIGPRSTIAMLERSLQSCADVETEIRQTDVDTGPNYRSRCVFSPTIPLQPGDCQPKHWF